MTHTSDSGRNDEELERNLGRLLSEVEALGGGDEHRREPLLERAEERGIDRAAAERAYDVAREVGLDPAYGIALVGQRIGIRVLDGGSGARATEPVEPEWIDTPPSPEEAGRERRLRETFRRLRSFLEKEGDPRAAVASFGREPDLDLFDY